MILRDVHAIGHVAAVVTAHANANAYVFEDSK